MIYVLNIHKHEAEIDKVFTEATSLLSAKYQQKIARFYHKKDKYLCLGGQFLLKRIFKEHSIQSEVQFTETERPFVNGFDFNVSHDSELVVAGFTATGSIGVDVMKIQERELAHFVDCFTRLELNFISHGFDGHCSDLESLTSNEVDLDCLETVDSRFALMWTLKESFVKRNGMGITINLQELEIRIGAGLQIKCFFKSREQKLKFRSVYRDGYVLSVCLEDSDEDILVQELCWADFFTLNP